eukprot:g72294.t1
MNLPNGITTTHMLSVPTDWPRSALRQAWTSSSTCLPNGISCVDKFIHVSSLGATKDTNCKYLKTKAESEEAVLECIPDATIVRLGPVFGDEDQFVNKIAAANNYGQLYPLLEGGHQKLQPVSALDVANALLNIGTLSGTQGKTFHLGGPEVFTLRELQDLVRKKIYLDPVRLVRKKIYLDPVSEDEEYKYSEFYVDTDELWLQTRDLVVPDGPDVLTFEDLYMPTERLHKLSTTVDLQLIHQRSERGPPRFAADGSVPELAEWNTIWEDSELSVATPGVGGKRRDDHIGSGNMATLKKHNGSWTFKWKSHPTLILEKQGIFRCYV